MAGYLVSTSSLIKYYRTYKQCKEKENRQILGCITGNTCINSDFICPKSLQSKKFKVEIFMVRKKLTKQNPPGKSIWVSQNCGKFIEYSQACYKPGQNLTDEQLFYPGASLYSLYIINRTNLASNSGSHQMLVASAF